MLSCMPAEVLTLVICTTSSACCSKAPPPRRGHYLQTSFQDRTDSTARNKTIPCTIHSHPLLCQAKL